MKQTLKLMIASIAIILISCSGSDVYRGTWKAMDMDGQKLEITFAEKSLSIKDSTGKAVEFDYTQNSVNINNGVKTYGIKVSDGRGYQIHFPRSNDDSQGVIKDENGNPTYIISRTKYISYKEMFNIM